MIFDDCREAAKLFNHLQIYPLQLGGSASTATELQCMIVPRSVAESVSCPWLPVYS